MLSKEGRRSVVSWGPSHNLALLEYVPGEGGRAGVDSQFFAAWPDARPGVVITELL